MSGVSREQALALLTAAKNHGDLSVKLSSLKQAKEALRSLDISIVSELFPHITDLRASSESLIRKCVVELMEEHGLKAMKQSLIFMPVLFELLKDGAPIVVRQSIIAGTNFFCRILEELVHQFRQTNMVERWLEDLWMWIGKFKDIICRIALEPGSVSARLLAFKFLEVYIVLLTSGDADFGALSKEGNHPILDPPQLTQEASNMLAHFLHLLYSPSSLQGSLVIGLINCLAGIARKRAFHYRAILSALFEFDSNVGIQKGGHTLSIRYCLRTALLGFLRCTHPVAMESRDSLIKALRAMNAGDAADQVIRQVDKTLKTGDRASRGSRLVKDEQSTKPMSASGGLPRRKPLILDNSGLSTTDEVPSKRARVTALDDASNGTSSKLPRLDSSFTPVEQMIAMIGALLAEGERGFQSLEILISNIQPDLMADIVIANMKDLPPSPPSSSTTLVNLSTTSKGPHSTLSQVASTSPTVPVLALSSDSIAQDVTLASAVTISIPHADTPFADHLVETKRDPRRDPRRFDPRRASVPAGLQLASTKLEEVNGVQLNHDSFCSLSDLQSSVLMPVKAGHTSDSEALSCSASVVAGLPIVGNAATLAEVKDEGPRVDVSTTTDSTLPPVLVVDRDQITSASSEGIELQVIDASAVLQADQCSSAVSSVALAEMHHDLPCVPTHVDLSSVEQEHLAELAVRQIAETYRKLQMIDSRHEWQALLARLIAQNGVDDDIVMTMQNCIISDSKHQKGHELAVLVLYHLHILMISRAEECAFYATCYEKFLLAMAKSLRDSLPASDKSFSRLLSEAPYLPDSVLKLLQDLCLSGGYGTDIREGDRVTQGLGTVWSLILGRPSNRLECLDITLKCTVCLQDDVRAKAIRLVTNKLYSLDYASRIIEQFATDMLMSVVDHPVSDAEPRTGRSGENAKTSISASQSSEPGPSESESANGIRRPGLPQSTVSLSQAQCYMSLFFAVSTKKPSLLRLVFDIYGRATKVVKQVIHRHLPVLIRTLRSSYDELLPVIADASEGSENLLMLVLEILAEDKVPSDDLVATVKHLYATKMKDAAILIPLLSSLSQEEVLPIFPQLVGLPLEKFQTALARVLQGSAHTGPALTPVEVLIAIHDINPEKDAVPLKKITDACSACFEQRIVFTQQVLAKSLNHMVEKTPLPLLFMRTVIQAIDAFPTLVDFTMEILCKLVTKQIWRMPKLWAGFLKCAAQTAPHSFSVLLKLPAPQIENVLVKYPNLKAALAAYASQPGIRTSMTRSTLVVLGALSEVQKRRPHISAVLQTSDMSSTIQGAALS